MNITLEGPKIEDQDSPTSIARSMNIDLINTRDFEKYRSSDIFCKFEDRSDVANCNNYIYTLTQSRLGLLPLRSKAKGSKVQETKPNPIKNVKIEPPVFSKPSNIEQMRLIISSPQDYLQSDHSEPETVTKPYIPNRPSSIFTKL